MKRYAWLLLIVIFLAPLSYADSVVVNGKGSTFIINKLEGFDGEIGVQREAAFVAAANIWADILVSSVDITVDASFTSLTCNSSQAVLGSAGPNSVMNIASNAAYYNMVDNLTYPIALANSLAGVDFDSSGTDITAKFNALVDDNDACLNGVNWYYGLDHNPSGYDIDFFEVVLHELGHGIGILSFVDSSGSKFAGKNDTYIVNLKDETTGASWASMTQSEILASRTNTGNLVWTGSNVNALAHDLNEGVNNNQVQMYAPATFSSGSSISHFDTALSPNELMEPIYEGNSSYDHSAALLEDIGWSVVASDNIAPVITSQTALAVNEDDTLTVSLADLTITDLDNDYPTDFSLTVYSGSNYTVSGSTIIPNKDYSGFLTVPVSVHDGESSSDRFNMIVTVNEVNDAPMIVGQNLISIQEDTAKAVSVADFDIVDPDDSSFSLIIGSGDHYSVANGNEITPDINWFGSLVIPVSVTDGELNSANFNLNITVTPVNDLPVIQMAPVISTTEDSRVELSLDDFSVIDVDDSTFSLVISNGEHYSVSGAYLVPELNFSGNLDVGVKVFDGQGYSTERHLSIDVSEVNDTPSLSIINTQQINSGESLSLQASASDIEDDALSFSFIVAPSWLSISNSGLISGTADYSDIGLSSVSLSVSDGNTSDELTFLVRVVDTTSADLSVDLSVSEALVGLTENVSASLNIKSLGPVDAVDATATIDFDHDVTVVSYDSRCTIESTTKLLCAEAALLSSNLEGTSFDIEFNYSGDQVLNAVASVTSDTVDPNLTNNNSDASVFVLSEADSLVSVQSGIGSSSSSAVQVFDLADEEDSVKIVFANADTEQSVVYALNEFTSAVVGTSSLPDANNSVDVQVGDFNNDTFLDILLVNNNSASAVYLNDGYNEFSEQIQLGISDASAAVSTDLNNDGYLDVVIANQNNAPNDVYLSSSGTGFILIEQLGSGDSSSLGAMDYNRDGYIDIIVGNRNDDNYIYLNNGVDQSVSQFSDVAIVLGQSTRMTNAIEVLDLDGDGLVNEVIVGSDTSMGDGSIEGYRVTDSQTQTKVLSLDSGDVIAISAFNHEAAISFAALNSDGVVQVFEQDDTDQYSVETIIESGSGSDLVLTELNANDSIDLVIANSAGANQIFNDLIDYKVESLVDPIVKSGQDSELDTNTSTVESTSSLTPVKISKGSLGFVFIFMSLGLLLLRSKRTYVRAH